MGFDPERLIATDINLQRFVTYEGIGLHGLIRRKPMQSGVGPLAHWFSDIQWGASPSNSQSVGKGE